MKTGTTRIDHELLDQVLVHKSHTADGAPVEVFSYMKLGTTRIDHELLDQVLVQKAYLLTVPNLVSIQSVCKYT